MSIRATLARLLREAAADENIVQIEGHYRNETEEKFRDDGKLRMCAIGAMCYKATGEIPEQGAPCMTMLRDQLNWDDADDFSVSPADPLHRIVDANDNLELSFLEIADRLEEGTI